MSNNSLAMRPQRLELEWTAYYSDGTSLKQQYGQGKWDEEIENYSDEHHFGHIDQDKLVKFELTGEYGTFSLDFKTGEINAKGLVLRYKHLDLALDDPRMSFDKRLIYFRRTRQDNGPEGIKFINRFLLGWQATVEGKNIQFFIIAEPDGSVSIMNNR